MTMHAFAANVHTRLCVLYIRARTLVSKRLYTTELVSRVHERRSQERVADAGEQRKGV